ncbi:MAG: tryptophan-rich sensory protein [Balneolaceae bacterium]|nr:MAG: tryptophan-rich sensory protein [Balneolaceae bacterium]
MESTIEYVPARKTDSMPGRFFALLFFLALPQAAGLLGSVFTRPAIQAWYVSLDKPWFTPPDIVFPIVWPLLFLMMGIASYLVWKERNNVPAARQGLYLYATQLSLNVAWSILFFGIKSPEAAFYEIIVLILAVVATTVAFFRSRILAGWLMVPYILWLLFAALLNYSIWVRNPF